MPWTRRRQFRSESRAGATFRQRPIRLAAATAVVGLLAGNGVLVYELTREDAGPVRQETAPARDSDGGGEEATDLRSALDAVEAEISADVGRLTVLYRQTPDRRTRSQGSSAGRGTGTASQPEGDRATSASAGPASDDPSKSRFNESDGGADSGGSSRGSSPGGDTSNDSSSESGGDSSSGSGSSDAGGTSGTGGGGGGGDGGGDTSGDVSGSGGTGGGGGG